MYVTHHAVRRFKERVLYEFDPIKDNTIRDLILREASRSPLIKMETLKNFGGAERIIKYYYKCRYKSDDFYAVTDEFGEGIVTVIDYKTAAKWTVFSVCQTIPMPRQDELPVAVGAGHTTQVHDVKKPLMFIPRAGTTTVAPVAPAAPERSAPVMAEQPVGLPPKKSLIIELAAELKIKDQLLAQKDEEIVNLQIEVEDLKKQAETTEQLLAKAKLELEEHLREQDEYSAEELEALRGRGYKVS